METREAAGISVSEGFVIGDAAKRLDALVGDVVQALEVASSARSGVSSLVAEVRSESFMAADPNVRVVVGGDNEEAWANEVDVLEIKGTGDAQHLVVQDAPTNFRVKELNVDPVGVVGFQLNLADFGLDNLARMAAISSGRPGLTESGVDGSDGGSVGAPSRRIDAEVGKLIEEQLASLRSKAELLESGLGEGEKSTPADGRSIAAVRGLLERATARLGALKESGATEVIDKMTGDGETSPAGNGGEEQEEGG